MGLSADIKSLDDIVEFAEFLEILFNDDNSETNGDEPDANSDYENLLISNDEKKLITDISEKLGTLNYNIILSGIAEVTQADDRGYAIDIDAGISAEVELLVNIDNLGALYGEIQTLINDSEASNSLRVALFALLLDAREIFGEGELFIKFNVAIAALMSGSLRYNSDFELTHVNLSADAVVDAGLETNIDLIRTMEIDYQPYSIMSVENDEEDESDEVDSFVKYLSDEKKDTYNLIVGASLESNAYLDSIVVDDIGIGVDAKMNKMTYLVGGYIFAEAPDEILDALRDELDISDAEEIEEGAPVQYSEMWADVEYDEDFDFDDFPIETLDIVKFFIEEIEVDRDSELFLKGKEKTDVRNDFNKVKNKLNGATSKLEDSTVTLYKHDSDDEDEVYDEFTVPFNKRINLPVLPDIIDDDDDNEMLKFVGWEIEDDEVMWNSSWKVKGDVELYPVYAEVYDDYDEAIGSTEKNKFVKMHIDGLDDEEYNFVFNGTMNIGVYDDDGKLLYTWRIVGDGITSDGKVTNFKIEVMNEGGHLDKVKEELDDSILYLDFKSSGDTPTGTIVNYNVDNRFKDDTTLNVYFVEEDDDGFKGLTLIDTVKVAEGTASFDVYHCSGYVLHAISEPSDGGLSEYYVYAAIAVVAILLIAGIAYVMHSRRA